MRTALALLAGAVMGVAAVQPVERTPITRIENMSERTSIVCSSEPRSSECPALVRPGMTWAGIGTAYCRVVRDERTECPRGTRRDDGR